MSDRPFRFAVQATPQDGPQWLATARRAEELGYATLMMPDGMRCSRRCRRWRWRPGRPPRCGSAPSCSCSALRPPGLAAWDAHSLSVLSGERFEFGIGTGRPEVVEQAVRLAGQPPTTGAERLARVGQTIDALRELDGGRCTPAMAAGGPRARALAAAKADIVTLATGPFTSREEAARLAAEVRETAGPRADSIEFESPIFVVGDEAPPWVRRFLQADLATLVERDSLLIVRGSPRQMADELLRRREEIGVSYVSVNSAFCEQFAPVVELLARG